MLVIDVGAHNGSVFSLPHSQDPTVVVYAIEPNPQLAEKLQSFNRPNLHVFCTAFGEIDGISQLYLNRNDQTSSLLRVHCNDAWKSYEDQLQSIQIIDVPVQRLDTFVQAQRIAEIDILKIDAQGFDLQVLKGAGKALHSISKIQLEVQLQPLYEGSGTKEEILEYLSDRGFRLIRASQQTDGLEENLEFVRVNRYPLTKPGAEHFEVCVPHVGVLKTPRNDHVGQLLEKGEFEGLEQAFLWLYLRPGDTFLDGGAHAGLFSSTAAKCMSHSGRILGFDPNPLCFSLYKQNLEDLGYCHFTALNVGLSDKDGVARLLLGKPGLSAFSTFAPDAVYHPEISTDTIEVMQRSLDSILREFQVPHISLAKLDVEGWETFVLTGAQQSIAAGKFPVWMIEFTEANAVAAGSSTQALRSLIERLGYTLCRFDATNLQLIPEPHRPFYSYANLFAVIDVKAVNQRLQTADSQSVAIAKDLILRHDNAVQRDLAIRHLVNFQAMYEQTSCSLWQLVQELEQTKTFMREIEDSNLHLESELAYLSTGRAARRGVVKSILRKLGLYDFVYRHHHMFVPVYNRLSGDHWQPSTLKKDFST